MAVRATKYGQGVSFHRQLHHWSLRVGR
jgi:hypothetical protein